MIIEALFVKQPVLGTYFTRYVVWVSTMMYQKHILFIARIDMGTQEKNLVFTHKLVFGDWFDCQWFFYFDPNNRRVPQYQKDK